MEASLELLVNKLYRRACFVRRVIVQRRIQQVEHDGDGAVQQRIQEKGFYLRCFHGVVKM